MQANPPLTANKGETCMEHPDEPFKFYCTIHNEVICSICAVKLHKSCDDTLTFDEAVELFESERNNLFISLDNQSEKLHNALTIKQAVVSSLSSSAQEIELSIRDLAKRIHTLIDEKSREVISTVEQMKQDHQNILQSDINTLQQLWKVTSKIKQKTENAFAKKAHIDMIHALTRVQNAFCEIEISSKDALERPNVKLGFKISTDLEHFTQVFDSFGETILNNTECEVINDTAINNSNNSTIDEVLDNYAYEDIDCRNILSEVDTSLVNIPDEIDEMQDGVSQMTIVQNDSLVCGNIPCIIRTEYSLADSESSSENETGDEDIEAQTPVLGYVPRLETDNGSNTMDTHQGVEVPTQEETIDGENKIDNITQDIAENEMDDIATGNSNIIPNGNTESKNSSIDELHLHDALTEMHVRDSAIVRASSDNTIQMNCASRGSDISRNEDNEIQIPENEYPKMQTHADCELNISHTSEVNDIALTRNEHEVTTISAYTDIPIVYPCATVNTNKNNVAHFQTVDHRKPCWIYGLAYLPDKCLVITDVAHDSLQLYDNHYQLIGETIVNFTPWDVAAVNDTTIAVCSGGKQSLNIFTIYNDSFMPVKVYDLDSDCISVAYKDGVLTAGTRRGVVLVSEEGEIMARIEKNSKTHEAFRRVDFLTVGNNTENTFIVNSWASKTISVAPDGTKQWEYQSKDVHPRGTAWHNGRLYVATRNQHKLALISEDGVWLEEIGQEGLQFPYAVAAHPLLSVLAVSQWDEQMDAEKSRTVRLVKISDD